MTMMWNLIAYMANHVFDALLFPVRVNRRNFVDFDGERGLFAGDVEAVLVPELLLPLLPLLEERRRFSVSARTSLRLTL